MLFNFSTHNKLLSYSAAVSDFIFAAHSLRNGNDPHITSLTGMFVSLNFLLAWKARWECLFARVDTVSRILISGKGGKPGNFLVSFFYYKFTKQQIDFVNHIYQWAFFWSIVEQAKTSNLLPKSTYSLFFSFFPRDILLLEFFPFLVRKCAKHTTCCCYSLQNLFSHMSVVSSWGIQAI